MAQKRNNPKERQIGKNPQAKKPLIDPRYKNTVWTIIIMVILLIFFIVNNTRTVADSGPLPPGYNQDSLKSRLNTEVPEQLKMTDSSGNKK
jgi:hypothetical protein